MNAKTRYATLHYCDKEMFIYRREANNIVLRFQTRKSTLLVIKIESRKLLKNKRL